MTDKELNEVMRQEPFLPVVLVLSNGSRCEVKHPDAILISRRVSAVLVGQAIRLISNAHINEIVPVAA